MSTALLLIENAATLFLTGVLWTMQVLNYPLLSLVGRDALPGYESEHNKRFALVVFPGVLVGIVGAVGLILARPARVPAFGPIAEVVLMVAIIVSTAALQAPQHGRLARGWDATAYHLLVRSNWIRVALWSLAGLLSLFMTQQVISGQ